MKVLSVYKSTLDTRHKPKIHTHKESKQLKEETQSFKELFEQAKKNISIKK